MPAAWVKQAQTTGAGVLPRDAERALMAASRVGTPDSRQRQRAIDAAYTTTSRAHPHLFKD